MCPACATVTPEYRPRFSRCCPSRCAARLLDRTRLRPPRARRVATPPKPAERDQVRLPTAREGAAPDFAKVYSDYKDRLALAKAERLALPTVTIGDCLPGGFNFPLATPEDRRVHQHLVLDPVSVAILTSMT